VTMTRFATLAVAMVVAAWVSSSIVQFIWRWWARSEQLRVLGHQAVENRGLWYRAGIWSVVWPVIALACFAAAHRLPDLISPHGLKDIAHGTEGTVIAIWSLAFNTALVAAWLLPGPRVPGSNTRLPE